MRILRSGSSNTDGDFELTGLRGGGYTVTISDFGDVEFPVTSREVTVGVGLSASVSFNAPGEDPVDRPAVVTRSSSSPRSRTPPMKMTHTRAK